MFSARAISWMIVMMAVSEATAANKVGVAGSSIRFDDELISTVSSKPVELVLTGTALREKFFINVYAIGSYVKKGQSINNAAHLARIDTHKELHLVLERNVSGPEMAAGVKKSITANYSVSEFPKAFDEFMTFLSANPVKAGDRVRITHLPGVGVKCDIQGKSSVTIKNLKFARAMWDIYLGKKNIGMAIKKNLVSRL